MFLVLIISLSFVVLGFKNTLQTLGKPRDFSYLFIYFVLLRILLYPVHDHKHNELFFVLCSHNVLEVKLEAD